MNNREIKEFFISYLEDRGYNNHDGKLSKGFVIINFMANGKMIRATDENPNHSHQHIVSCQTPKNIEDADCWFRLLDIDKKEVGSNAWKVIKNRDFNDKNNS
jgi:hypothetical protein